MANKDERGLLSEKTFYEFLARITGFILASRFVRPGNSTAFFNEMANIATGQESGFKGYEFDVDELADRMNKFDFINSSKITRSIITWQAFQDKQQTLLALEGKYDIEHILPRRREGELIRKANLESIGNKSLLEKEINIRASDYRFRDKANYYLGFLGKKATQIHELAELAQSKSDFTEQDIEQRKQDIINNFINFIRKNNLAK